MMHTWCSVNGPCITVIALLHAFGADHFPAALVMHDAIFVEEKLGLDCRAVFVHFLEHERTALQVSGWAAGFFGHHAQVPELAPDWCFWLERKWSRAQYKNPTLSLPSSNQKHSPNLLKENALLSKLVGTGSIILLHLNKLWKAKFF